MPRYIKNRAVMEVLSEAARAFDLKKIAPELDKLTGSLYAELNPYGEQGKGKLSLDDAIEVMRIIQDFTALELIAAEFGFHLVKKNACPDKLTVHEELVDDTRAIGRWADVCADPNATKTEVILARQELRNEIDETEVIKLRELEEKV